MSNTYIVSDLHIGLRHFKQELFSQFISALPDGSTLVLNGDTLDDPTRQLGEEDERGINLLIEHSTRLRIVWVRGNHDAGFCLDDPGEIEFADFHSIPERGLYISHGAHFDNVMPHNLWFIKLFRWLHMVRIMLGASPVHVAEYAKKWRLLYNYLRTNVSANAIEHARENGWEHVVCGHVHYPEVRHEGGVVYYNTGSWTERPAHYLHITDNCIELLDYNGGPLHGHRMDTSHR